MPAPQYSMENAPDVLLNVAPELHARLSVPGRPLSQRIIDCLLYVVATEMQPSKPKWKVMPSIKTPRTHECAKVMVRVPLFLLRDFYAVCRAREGYILTGKMMSASVYLRAALETYPDFPGLDELTAEVRRVRSVLGNDEARRILTGGVYSEASADLFLARMDGFRQ